MKKIAILAAAVFCSPLAMSKETAPATPPAATVSQAELDAAINELVEMTTCIVEILESAKDKETADAVAAKLKDYRGRMEATQAKFEELSKSLTEEQQMLILQKIFPLAMSMGPRMEAVTKKLEETDCFGSEDLKAVLSDEAE